MVLGWGWGGHAIEDWISIGETVPVKVPGKGWLRRWRVQVLDGIQTDTKYHWADGRPWQERETMIWGRYARRNIKVTGKVESRGRRRGGGAGWHSIHLRLMGSWKYPPGCEEGAGTSGATQGSEM